MTSLEDPNVIRSVKGHTYYAGTTEACDHIISALNERIHLASESGRLLSWIPIWRSDIDQLLEHRSYLAMCPKEESC